MSKKSERINVISNQLLEDYPTVDTPLQHSNGYELTVSAVLSPQTPDETTNKVTPVLFKKYPDFEALSGAEFEDVLKIIRPINYNKTKSKRLIDLSNKIVTDFNSEIPHTMDELLTLPGVGRKVANVIISEWLALQYEDVLDQGFVVDTHVMRVSRRLGLSFGKTPEKIEADLMKIWPAKEWRAWSLRLIFHGREISQARNPQFTNHPKWGPIYAKYGVKKYL